MGTFLPGCVIRFIESISSPAFSTVSCSFISSLSFDASYPVLMLLKASGPAGRKTAAVQYLKVFSACVNHRREAGSTDMITPSETLLFPATDCVIMAAEKAPGDAWDLSQNPGKCSVLIFNENRDISINFFLTTVLLIIAI